MGIPKKIPSGFPPIESPRFTASTASLQDDKLAAEILCNLSGVLSLALQHSLR